MILKARWLSTSHLFPEALIHWEVYIDLRTQISQIMSEVSGFKMPLLTAIILVDSRSCLILSNSNWAQPHWAGPSIIVRTSGKNPPDASSTQSFLEATRVPVSITVPVLNPINQYYFFAGKSTLLIFSLCFESEVVQLYCRSSAMQCLTWNAWSAVSWMPGTSSRHPSFQLFWTPERGVVCKGDVALVHPEQHNCNSK